MGRFSPTVGFYAGNEIGQGLERGVENFFRMQEMKRRRKEEDAERPIMEALRLAEMRRMGVRGGGDILDQELGGLQPRMMSSAPPGVPTSVNNVARGMGGEIPKTALDAAERRTALRRDPTLHSSMATPTVRTPTMTVADQNVGPSMSRLPREPDEPHPGYQKLGDTGFYYDETVTPEHQRIREQRDMERRRLEALLAGEDRESDEWDRRQGVLHQNRLGEIGARAREYRSRRPIAAPKPPAKPKEDALMDVALSAVEAAGGDLQKAIALVDQSPDKVLFGQGLSSRHFMAAVDRYKTEREVGRYRPRGGGLTPESILQEFRAREGGQASSPQAPVSQPEEDVLPQDYLDEAANDPEYAEFLRQNGYDPATGRRLP